MSTIVPAVPVAWPAKMAKLPRNLFKSFTNKMGTLKTMCLNLPDLLSRDKYENAHLRFWI